MLLLLSSLLVRVCCCCRCRCSYVVLFVAFVVVAAVVSFVAFARTYCCCCYYCLYCRCCCGIDEFVLFVIVAIYPLRIAAECRRPRTSGAVQTRLLILLLLLLLLLLLHRADVLFCFVLIHYC